MNKMMKVAQSQIDNYEATKARFVATIEKMGPVYTMRHHGDEFATAEYAMRLGHQLKSILTEHPDNVADFVRDLNRRLRQTANGGNLDGEYGKNEVTALARILDAIDPIPYL